MEESGELPSAARRAELRMDAAELSGTLPALTMAREVLRTAAACRSRTAARRADCCFPATTNPDLRSSISGPPAAASGWATAEAATSAEPLRLSPESYRPCAAAFQKLFAARLVLGVGAWIGRNSAASGFSVAGTWAARSSVSFAGELFGFSCPSSTELVAAMRQKSIAAAAIGGGAALGSVVTRTLFEGTFGAGVLFCSTAAGACAFLAVPGAVGVSCCWSLLTSELRLDSKPRQAAASQKLLTRACIRKQAHTSAVHLTQITTTFALAWALG